MSATTVANASLEECERRGREDQVRFSYIHPDWTPKQVNAWAKGYGQNHPNKEG